MSKSFYPVIISPAEEGGYLVDVPDLSIGTQGDSIPDAIYMARDAIGLWCICQQDMGKSVPSPSTISPAHGPDDIVTLVDIDIDAYRRANDDRAVRRNVTLPSWLNEAANAAKLNVSAILQSALKAQLGL